MTYNASEAERRFRIMDGLPSIPWSAIAPYEDNARANHGQTLERLNTRGGLDVCELWAVVHGKRGRDVPLVAECRAWFDVWRAAHEGQQITIDSLRSQLDAARGEIERLKGDEATMKLSRMIGLGDPVRPDIHAKVIRDRDRLALALDELLDRRKEERDAALAKAEAERDEAEARASMLRIYNMVTDDERSAQELVAELSRVRAICFDVRDRLIALPIGVVTRIAHDLNYACGEIDHGAATSATTDDAMSVVVSASDADKIVALLDEQPEPTPAMLALFAEHTKGRGE